MKKKKQNTSKCWNIDQYQSKNKEKHNQVHKYTSNEYISINIE